MKNLFFVLVTKLVVCFMLYCLSNISQFLSYGCYFSILSKIFQFIDRLYKWSLQVQIFFYRVKLNRIVDYNWKYKMQLVFRFRKLAYYGIITLAKHLIKTYRNNAWRLLCLLVFGCIDSKNLNILIWINSLYLFWTEKTK